jgi:Matrixin
MHRTLLLAGAAALVAAAALPASADDTSVKDATTMTMSAPSRATVPFSGKATVTGAVSGVLDLLSSQEGRTVALELRTPNGWMPMRSHALTAEAGQYTVRLPSDWYYRGVVRTSVSASGTHEAETSGTTATVRVRPPYSPAGKASSWSRMFEDPSVRWDPCKVITVKVNDDGAPSKAVRQVRQALRKLGAATGIRFRYAGRTNAIPWRTDGKKSEYSDAAMTISWATPRQVRPLSGSTVGWGGGWARDDEIFRGGIALDRTARLRSGFGKGATWGAVLLHELAHVMGLGHVGASEQLMYPSILPSTQGRYEAGDLAGLRDQGAMQGCVAPAAPRRTTAPRFFVTY